MKRIGMYLLCAVLLGCGRAPTEVALNTENEKTLYAVGVAVGSQLTSLGLTETELEQVKAGLTDSALQREPKVPMDTYRAKIQAFVAERQGAAVAEEKKKSEEFVAKIATEQGIQRTPGGAYYRITTEGSGATPTPDDTVKIHYTGKLIDGTVFDSSVQRGQPAELPLNRVIRCWGEGLPMLKPGGKIELYCPPDTAYGDRGNPPKIKGGAALVFDVELLEVVPKPAAAQPPTQ